MSHSEEKGLLQPQVVQKFTLNVLFVPQAELIKC